MYTYKRAVGVNQLSPRGEELVDIAALSTRELVATYRELKIVIADAFYANDVVITLADYINEYQAFDGTIQAWLDTKATTPLITSNTLPGNVYRHVTMQDIQYKWFTLFPGDASRGKDHQEHLDVATAPDIRVLKTDGSSVDYEALNERSLWTYNGHLVRGVTDGDGIYLLNAGKHFNVNDNAHVGNLNFNTLSKLKTYPIREEDIDFEEKDTYAYLHLRTPVSMEGKAVWASIGGRLYLADVVTPISQRGLVVNTQNVDWFSALFDSKEMIDLSNVICPEREVVDKNFFKTERFWKALLTDPSSFLIVLDNPNLYVWTRPVTSYQYPFTYHMEETRDIPLLVSNGLLPTWYTRKIINRRLRDIDIGTKRKYVNKTAGLNNGGEVYHGYTNRFTPSNLHNGYLLYIRSIIQGD